jgi:putative membrane protein
LSTRTSLLILSVAIAGLLAACNNNEAPNDTAIGDTAGATPEGTTTPGTDTTPPYDSTGAMTPDGAMGVQTGPITDTDFYQLATQSSQKEIAAGNLAKDQASDAAVKDYAQMMVTDHTAMSQQVQDAAGTADAAAPAPDPTATADLQGKSGADFDRAYIDMMVMDHQKAVAIFENAAQNASTDEAKALAQGALPKLRDHLQKAQDLQSRLGGGAMVDATADDANP